MMTDRWTQEDIEIILAQLDTVELPFKKYAVAATPDGKPLLLGKGASAYVYKALRRKDNRLGYAIKVIGFGDTHMDSASFRDVAGWQKSLSCCGHVVEIYHYTELKVWITDRNTVTYVEELGFWNFEDEPKEGECLVLQFIVMEDLTSLIHNEGYGKMSLAVPSLQTYDEQAILQFAYDIGRGLLAAHEDHIIHRDVKLENIFYDTKKDCYKLGDFGIAKVTKSGMASTVAFSDGYGAPEVVGALEDRYNQTADIYSFGMTLYVLLNELRFPDSCNYHPNFNQYAPGYEPQPPVNGSEELQRIVLKMLRYNPEERYQSMEEVLNALEQLQYGQRIGFQRRQKKQVRAMAVILTVLGALSWVAAYKPDLVDGYGWLLGLLYLDQKWVAVTLLILAVWMLFYLWCVIIREQKYMKYSWYVNWHWSLMLLTFGLPVLGDWLVYHITGHHPDMAAARFTPSWFIEHCFHCYDPLKVCKAGTVFCLIWVVRDHTLFRRERHKGV